MLRLGRLDLGEQLPFADVIADVGAHSFYVPAHAAVKRDLLHRFDCGRQGDAGSGGSPLRRDDGNTAQCHLRPRRIRQSLTLLQLAGEAKAEKGDKENCGTAGDTADES